MRVNRIYNYIAPWLLPIILISLWQVLSMVGVISSHILPQPSVVLKTTASLMATGEIWTHISVSTLRALTGFAIGGSIGFLLGLLNGLYPLAKKYLDTTVQMLRNVPHLALIPIVILWFGVGEEAKIFLVAIGVFFPIYINTYHGIRSVDKKLIEMGEVYRLSHWHLFKHVIFKGALPSILVGIRYSLGVMWLTLIVAETVAATSGIGYMAMNAREFMQLDIVVIAILLYALLGKMADVTAGAFERRLLRWNSAYQLKN
ncbi:MAG TPA: aliphatic sulfonate ABC transporter permease SsuC [Bacillota bacterium]|nr:aliphatic sulfonate ABC transporter permease SsuC [Bacillota bacterium]